MKLIAINNLEKKYQTISKEIVALENVNLDIFKGEIISIVGPSGCGKSTLLNILTGLEKCDNDSIKTYDDIHYGYMMQNDALFPWLTVYENSIMGLKLKKILNKENIEYTNNLLKKYGLYDFKDEYPSTLSGGMRQRLSLIRTLATKPNILLLDEPFSKLDIDSRIKISDDVIKIVKDLGITTILITHDIAEAISLSNRVATMKKRPGTIKNIFEINLNGNLPSEKRGTEEFYNLYNKIWEDIEHE